MDVKLHAFPSRDREFVALVEASYEALWEPRTTEDLQRALRQRYPAAVVTQQADLARHGDGPIVWYAFRTAAAGGSPVADLPDGDAWAIVDNERRFLEVSPQLARIAELPARRMIGHTIEDFSNPSDPTIRDDIARLWDEFRQGGGLAATVRFNYADGRPRELAYRLTADAAGAGRHKLSVHVLGPPGVDGRPVGDDRARDGMSSEDEGAPSEDGAARPDEALARPEDAAARPAGAVAQSEGRSAR